MAKHSLPSHAPSLLAGLIFFLLPALASAQGGAGESLRGRVVRDGTGIAGVAVELHRVTPDASGVVDRSATGADGTFEFRLPPVDTVGFTVFFATAEHGSVRHFGRPLHPSDPKVDYVVEVYDTTSAPQTPVRLARRDLVFLPQSDGSWEVNEILRLHNAGERTVVSGSGTPTATVDLPPAAADFQAGDGDAPTDQVRRMGDRVLLLMPILPGDREIFLRYRLPARPASAEVGARSPADSVNVFVRQPAPSLTVQGLSPVEMVDVEGERFLRYAGAGGEPGAVVVAWAAPSAPPVDPVVAALAVTVTVLLVGGAAAYRNRAA